MPVNRIQLLGVVFLTLTRTVIGYQWPSPQYDALESLLYEGRRRDGSNLASIQHPCKRRPGSQASIGAEWLRLAYHDVATHNIETGTGGLDASIAFELDREENSGDGMHHAIQDFETFPTKYISRADVIALGIVFAVASCDGPIIPFRGGRVDALTADVPGVPEPHQDLATHTEIFRRQGFSQEEMIVLVACGHTLGGVRSKDFPAVVPPPEDPSKNNFEMFDTTTQFDNDVVMRYIDGTTLNPLVVDGNVTMRSDARIFEADNNATMRRLTSPDEFSSSCRMVLEKMLNVVPSGVTLTEEITLLPVKVSNVQLTIEKGELVFKATLRFAQPANAPNKNRLVKIFWCDRYGEGKDCSNGFGKTAGVASSPRVDDVQISPITFRAGLQFVNYDFVVPIKEAESISSFWFEVDEQDGTRPQRHDNNGKGYPIVQDTILYIPRLSTIDYLGANRLLKKYNIVAAVKNTASPSRVYLSAFDKAIGAFGPPLIEDVEMTLNGTLPSSLGYSFYSASVEDSGLQLTIDLNAVLDGETLTEDYMQTFFVAGRAPYTNPTNLTSLKTTPPSSDSASSWSLEFGHIPILFGVLTFILTLAYIY